MVSKVFDARAHPSLFIPCYPNDERNLVVVDDDDYETINKERRDDLIQSPVPPSSASTASTRSSFSNFTSSRPNPDERLYHQALEHKKKLELMRRKVAKGVSTNVPAIPSAKPRTVIRQTLSEGSNYTRPSSNPRINRLYGLSNEKQEYGKKRREEIARASAMRNALPPKNAYGKIPLSRADGMYHKGLKAIRTKEAWVAQKQEEKDQQIDAQHEFKLAQGAFAYSFDRDYKFGPST